MWQIRGFWFEDFWLAANQKSLNPSGQPLRQFAQRTQQTIFPFGPPMVDPVQTKVLLKPDSTFYVCQLTGFPFVPGSAKVYNLTAAGDLSTHAEGFTCLTYMNFDPKDGNLCVLQFGEFGMVDTTFNFKLGTAAVIKLRPNGQRDTIARGIGGLAPSFIFDGKGGMYVTDLVFGQVLKYDLTSAAHEEYGVLTLSFLSQGPIIPGMQ